jgi:hypothetical protein
VGVRVRFVTVWRASTARKIRGALALYCRCRPAQAGVKIYASIDIYGNLLRVAYFCAPCWCPTPLPFSHLDVDARASLRCAPNQSGQIVCTYSFMRTENLFRFLLGNYKICFFLILINCLYLQGWKQYIDLLPNCAKTQYRYCIVSAILWEQYIVIKQY